MGRVPTNQLHNVSSASRSAALPTSAARIPPSGDLASLVRFADWGDLEAGLSWRVILTSKRATCVAPTSPAHPTAPLPPSNPPALPQTSKMAPKTVAKKAPKEKKAPGEKRPEVKAKNPSATFGELGKILGAQWKALSDAQKASYKR